MSKYWKLLSIINIFLLGCSVNNGDSSTAEIRQEIGVLRVLNENIVETSLVGKATFPITFDQEGWMNLDVEIIQTGRYRVEIAASADSSCVVWLEDYIDNKDGRTYNVTGDIRIMHDSASYGVDGSPFNQGLHHFKLHVQQPNVTIYQVSFELIKAHAPTPVIHTQAMSGTDQELVWSDEFDGNEIDTSKWIYAVGDWGWGNNELQYYTENDTKNARLENGFLVIEARKNENGNGWTSARLTTRGKQSFKYGKIEFRAQVPAQRGNWAAGWTLGDSYLDELSWPYCGEIDILESVGYEVDDATGDGIAHATVHTPAYYFKINNQISNTKAVPGIASTFHTYAVVWTPTEIKGFVDGQQYYLYDKNANALEWPFDQPQNIILNLAMGGGWGGAKGVDETIQSQKFIIDYVRVYDLK
jgi:beta-glucanase (GH16 family)